MVLAPASLHVANGREGVKGGWIVTKTSRISER
jgi:hypothetical protein